MVQANGVEVVAPQSNPGGMSFTEAVAGGQEPATGAADQLLEELYGEGAGAGAQAVQVEPQKLVDPVVDRLGPVLSAKLLNPQGTQQAPNGSSTSEAIQPDPNQVILEQQRAANAQLAADLAATRQQMQQLQTDQMTRVQESLARIEEARNNPTLTPEQRQAQVVKEWEEFNNASPSEMIRKIMGPQVEAFEKRIAELNEQLEKNNVPLRQFRQTQVFEENLAALSAPGPNGAPAVFPEMANPNFKALAFSKPLVDHVISTHPSFKDPNISPEEIYTNPNFLYALAQEARYRAAQSPQVRETARVASQAREQQSRLAGAPLTPGSRAAASSPARPLDAGEAFKVGLMSSGKSFSQAVAESGKK